MSTYLAKPATLRFVLAVFGATMLGVGLERVQAQNHARVSLVHDDRRQDNGGDRPLMQLTIPGRGQDIEVKYSNFNWSQSKGPDYHSGSGDVTIHLRDGIHMSIHGANVSVDRLHHKGNVIVTVNLPTGREVTGIK